MCRCFGKVGRAQNASDVHDAEAGRNRDTRSRAQTDAVSTFRWTKARSGRSGTDARNSACLSRSAEHLLTNKRGIALAPPQAEVRVSQGVWTRSEVRS